MTHDLLINLFKAYLSVKDKEFVRYIDAKKDSYDEGNEITPDELMNLASNKFKLLKQTGKWEAPDENEEKLLALQTEIKKLKQKARNIQERPGKERKRKGDRDATKTPRPDWLENHVKPNQVKDTKQWKNNTYHWCSPETGGKCDGKWRVHKPSKCKGIRKGEIPSRKNKEIDTDKEKRTLKFADALQTLTIQDGSDNESE